MNKQKQHTQVDTQAREWFLRNDEGKLTPTEAKEFELWMQQAANRESYLQLENICLSLSQLSPESCQQYKQPQGENFNVVNIFNSLFNKLSQWARHPQYSFSLALLLAVSGWFALQGAETPAQQSYTTSIGQQKIINLSDGSQVTLGANSELIESFNASTRQVKLNKGQAFFDIAKNKQRPFLVDSGSANIQVVGTRFDVRRNSSNVKITVEEGIVSVLHTPAQTPSNPTPPDQLSTQRLTAGQQLQVNKQSLNPVEAVDIAKVASWRNGQLQYRNATLADVIADANRYRQGRIILSPASLGELRVTSSFNTQQIDTMLEMLSESLPIVSRNIGDQKVLITAELK